MLGFPWCKQFEESKRRKEGGISAKQKGDTVVPFSAVIRCVRVLGNPRLVRGSGATALRHCELKAILEFENSGV